MKHELIKLLAPYFEILVIILDLLCVIILLWGIAIAAKDFFLSECKRPSREDAVKEITSIRSLLGSYILLSLEVLIAADIVDSIVNPSLQDLIILGSIVIIRTVLSYFLHKEIEDTQREQLGQKNIIRNKKETRNE